MPAVLTGSHPLRLLHHLPDMQMDCKMMTQVVPNGHLQAVKQRSQMDICLIQVLTKATPPLMSIRLHLQMGRNPLQPMCQVLQALTKHIQKSSPQITVQAAMARMKLFMQLPCLYNIRQRSSSMDVYPRGLPGNHRSEKKQQRR